MPQLALQQNCPAGHVLRPHVTPPPPPDAGLASHRRVVVSQRATCPAHGCRKHCTGFEHVAGRSPGPSASHAQPPQ